MSQTQALALYELDWSSNTSLQELEKEKEAEAMRQKAYPSFGPGSVLELTLVSPLDPIQSKA